MDDLPRLVDHFLRLGGDSAAALRVSSEAWRALRSHRWPGNVRELQNGLRRGVIFAERRWIRSADFGIVVTGVRDAAYADGADEFGQTELTLRQREALLLARESGVIRRRDLIGRFGIHESSAPRPRAAG